MANPFSWRILDGLLRGTLSPDESDGLIKSLLVWQIALAAFYGLCLGLFGLASREVPDARFMVGSAFKLPVLILGTTAVTFPSLYVFLALFGIRMAIGQMLAAALAANTILATVIASLGPVVGFFCLTTESYAFVLLLNVVVCGLGGVLGVRVIMLAINKALPISKADRVAEAEPEPEPEDGGDGDEALADSDGEAPQYWEVSDAERDLGSPSFLSLGSGARGIMIVWVALFAFVGTQMAWILRPFIGHPEAGFVAFRGKDGSFADAVMRALGQYFGG